MSEHIRLYRSSGSGGPVAMALDKVELNGEDRFIWNDILLHKAGTRHYFYEGNDGFNVDLRIKKGYPYKGSTFYNLNFQNLCDGFVKFENIYVAYLYNGPNCPEALFFLADRAKDVGEMSLANVIFAELFRRHLDQEHCYYLYLEDVEEYLDSYYDLAGIKNRETGSTVCIPLPLLTREAALEFMKQLESYSDRQDHNRDCCSSSPGYLKSLWDSFYGLVDRDKVERAVRMVLGNELTEQKE